MNRLLKVWSWLAIGSDGAGACVDVEGGGQTPSMPVRRFDRSSSKYVKHATATANLTQKKFAPFFALFNGLEARSHSATLAIFRILFSLVLLFHMLSWSTLFDSLQESYVVLHYPSAFFIKPLTPEYGGTLLGICVICTILLGFGFLTRAVTAFTFLTYGYLLHTCKSNYSDDHLLFLHILFIGFFVKWHRWLSIDAICRRRTSKRSKATVPRWHVFLLKLVTITPYVFSAIAKMSASWLLYGEPLKARLEHWGNLSHTPLPLLVAWTSFALDLMIPVMLFLGGQWQPVAVAGVILYQGCSLLYSVSLAQQLLLIISVVLHVEPQQPAKLLTNFKRTRSYALLVDQIDGSKDKDEEEDEQGAKMQAPPTAPPKPMKTRVMVGVSILIAFHFLFPIRHVLLYPMPLSWTLEGHYGAWQGSVQYRPGWLYLAVQETSGRVQELVPNDDPLVNAAQRQWIGMDPYSLLQYSARLRQVFQAAGREVSSIQVHACYSLDGRQYRELYRKDTNLLQYVEQYDGLFTTGLGKWMNRWSSAPACNPNAGPDKRFALTRRSREVYDAVQAAAGLRADIKNDEEGHPRVHVLHKGSDGASQPAYLWNNTRPGH